ncbi:MAG: hypothetical protein JST50_14845 [Bacteroidetes bacterium]|jgi:acetolactate synthase small subunit|nr:hypothetical protein [Bacteroidota bacterium]
MKKQSKTTSQFIFTVYAEDKRGLIGQLMVFFNRRYYDVHSLNVARTDISDLVMITIEATVPAPEVFTLQEKLKKIIEVHSVAVTPGEVGLKKTGFYRLSIDALGESLWQLLHKYGATLSSIDKDSLVISKTGQDKDLAELYSLLEGPSLLGFCKSALILESSLIPFEQLDKMRIEDHESAVVTN